MKPVIKIFRADQDYNQTIGSCVVYKDKKPIFSAISLERGWRKNEARVSCVPAGEYKVVLEYSNRFKKELWELKGVKNRSETKFHSANYWHQLNGCIALGRSLKDIDGDGYCDVTNSRNTMTAFHIALKDVTETTVIIKDLI